MATIKPIYDRIIVKPLDNDKRTRGGLIIPDMAIEGTPWQRGEVIAVGHGRLMAGGELRPLIIRERDIVVFFRNASGGEQLVVPSDDGTDLLCIRESHILGTLEGLQRGTGLLSIDGDEMTIQ